jgi:hypothetical protein
MMRNVWITVAIFFCATTSLVPSHVVGCHNTTQGGRGHRFITFRHLHLYTHSFPPFFKIFVLFVSPLQMLTSFADDHSTRFDEEPFQTATMRDIMHTLNLYEYTSEF